MEKIILALGLTCVSFGSMCMKGALEIHNKFSDQGSSVTHNLTDDDLKNMRSYVGSSSNALRDSLNAILSNTNAYQLTNDGSRLLFAVVRSLAAQESSTLDWLKTITTSTDLKSIATSTLVAGLNNFGDAIEYWNKEKQSPSTEEPKAVTESQETDGLKETEDQKETIEKLYRQLAVTDLRLAQLQNKSTDEKMKAIADLQKQTKELEKDRDICKQKAEKLQQKANEFEQKAQEYQKSDTELRGKLQEKESEVSALHQEIEKMNQKMVDNEKNYTTALEAKEREIEELRGQLKAGLEYNQLAFENEKQLMQGEKQLMQSQIEGLKKQVGVLLQKLNSQDTEHTSQKTSEKKKD